MLDAGRRVSRWVQWRYTVAVAAAAAFLLRLPGLTRPVRADEAGFTLVARAWDPAPDSLYGPYFVDRPPLLVAVFRFGDLLGGPMAVRVLGALACAALVLAAAWTARLVVGPGSAPWAAVCAAALTTNPVIDVVAVKGELLGLPFVMTACALAVLARRRGSAGLAFLAGAVACVPVGLKQNLTGGLVFAGVLLLATRATGRTTTGAALRLGAAGLAGAAVPVLATVAWAVAVGVDLHTLWYAVVGFRGDATGVLAAGGSEAPVVRAGVLVAAALAAGMLAVLGGFVVHVRDEWRSDPALTAATAALLLHDVAGLVLSGSYWRDYLFALVPATTLAAALLVRRTSRRGRSMRVVVLGAAVSSAACLVGWVVIEAAGLQEHHEHDTGVAVARAAAAGDTLVVFGGRPDLQLASGLRSPYQHLWSLPMRTLDPGYAELAALLAGPRAPTWLVEWVDLEAWDEEAGSRLRTLVEDRYDAHGTGCDDRPVFLLRGVDRPPLQPDCG